MKSPFYYLMRLQVKAGASSRIAARRTRRVENLTYVVILVAIVTGAVWMAERRAPAASANVTTPTPSASASAHPPGAIPLRIPMSAPLAKALPLGCGWFLTPTRAIPNRLADGSIDFDAYDVDLNRDGFVSQEEVEKLLHLCDKNGDQKLDGPERRSFERAMAYSENLHLLRLQDINGDGYVDPDEAYQYYRKLDSGDGHLAPADVDRAMRRHSIEFTEEARKAVARWATLEDDSDRAFVSYLAGFMVNGELELKDKKGKESRLRYAQDYQRLDLSPDLRIFRGAFTDLDCKDPRWAQVEVDFYAQRSGSGQWDIKGKRLRPAPRLYFCPQHEQVTARQSGLTCPFDNTPLEPVAGPPSAGFVVRGDRKPSSEAPSGPVLKAYRDYLAGHSKAGLLHLSHGGAVQLQGKPRLLWLNEMECIVRTDCLMKGKVPSTVDVFVAKTRGDWSAGGAWLRDMPWFSCKNHPPVESLFGDDKCDFDNLPLVRPEG